MIIFGLSTQGHWGTYATGDLKGLSPRVSPGVYTPRPSWAVGGNLLSNGESLNVEPLDS